MVSGLVISGSIKVNTQLILGPDKTNSQKMVLIKSIHFNRIAVDKVEPGQFCCLALRSLKKKEELTKKDFRKGIILLDPSLSPKYSVGFEAQVAVLHHSSTIKPGYESVMHCGVIRQTVRIVTMDQNVLRTGDKGTLVFKFMFNKEFIRSGKQFLLREGRTKILGKILKTYHTEHDLKEVYAKNKK